MGQSLMCAMDRDGSGDGSGDAAQHRVETKAGSCRKEGNPQMMESVGEVEGKKRKENENEAHRPERWAEEGWGMAWNGRRLTA